MYDIINVTKKFFPHAHRCARARLTKKESIMVNVRKQRLLIVLAVITALLFTAFGAVTSVSAATVSDDIAITYADNRNVVKILDEEAGGEPVYFKKLKETEELTSEEVLATMNRIVAVAKAYTGLKKTCDKIDASLEVIHDVDYDLWCVITELNSQKDSVFTDALKLGQNNYLTYDSDGANLAAVKEFASQYKTLSYEADLASELNSLFSVNNANPDGTPTSVYGFYDLNSSAYDYGAYELISCYEEGKQKIAESSSPADTRDEYKTKLNAVPRNVFEFVYNEYLEATAVERGSLSKEEADLDNNLIVKKMGECEKQVEEFYKAACDDIKTAYKTKYTYLQNYFANHQEYDGTAVSKNTSSIKYEKDGVVIMTIKAYIKRGYPTTKTEATVFAPNASIALYAGTLTGEARNVSDLLYAKNDKLGVGYFVRFNVYGGSVNSKVFDTEKANSSTPGGVIYEITFDLNKYYSKIVSQDQGALGKALKNVSFLKGVWGSSDKSEQIAKANEAIGGTETELCYLYQDGELKPFEKIDYQSGGILMLETTTFGNFAIAAVDSSSKLLGNIWFYIITIAAIIVILIIISLIKKFHKYTVKFYSNGGSKVKNAKARLGEYIAMPANPVRPGYVFAGWFTSQDLSERFVANRMVTRRNLKAYAKWNLELSKERIDRYYETLRNELAAHGALNEGCAIEEGKEKTFAVIVKGEKDIILYTAFELKTLIQDGYNVKASGEGYEETPSMFVISTRDDFVVAQKLVTKLIKTYDLKETEYEEAKPEEKRFALTLVAPMVVAAELETTEEAKPEETEETTEAVEETVEETKPEETEETTEQVEEPAPATEEQLIEYFTTIRNAVCGYALYEKNDKAEDGKMLVKLYKKEDAVYCYLALDPASYGLETVGLGFSDTPALMKVATDEDLEKAISLVEAVMLAHGFEKSDEPVEEKPYEGKGFGYRIHFVEE